MNWENKKMKMPNLIKDISCYLFFVFFFATAYLTAQAQFTSGSTGADGAFDPPENVNTVVIVPESGVLNYTTVNIRRFAAVRFTRNSRNTPIIILATGDVNIQGPINIDGNSPGPINFGGLGGPGGFSGGDGGALLNDQQITRGTNGEGPGGGMGGGSISAPGDGGGAGFSRAGGVTPNPQSGDVPGLGGSIYGLRTLVPLIGGSGGGGGSSTLSATGGGGGGGGGAILIASSTRITVSFTGQSPFFTPTISAKGGSAFGLLGNRLGGAGSGGSVRLISNVISGSLYVDVSGGQSFSGTVSAAPGSPGYVSIEAFDYSNLTIFAPTGPYNRSTPKPAVPVNPFTLRITSVGGLPAPAQPKGTFQDSPDIIVPTAQSNPVAVALAGANIPLGTTVKVTLTPENGNRITVQSTPLSGTVSASTATASISIPDGLSIIQASATIELTTPGAKAMFMNGEQVERVELKASYGGSSETVYVLKSGKRIVINE